MKIKWNFGLLYLTLGTWARPDGELGLDEEALGSSRSFSLFSVVQFPNDECTVASDNTMNGICRSADECGGANGIADGNCASGFGVCCFHRIESAAGSTTDINQNGSYVQNPNFPTAVAIAGVFMYRVMPSNAADVCQLRLDFEDVALTQPVLATGCATVDNIAIDAGGGIDPPPICGTLDGQHMYVATGKMATAATITLTKVGTTNSHWKIKIREIECGSALLPPDGCLQFHTGTSGVISSFNSAGTAPILITGPAGFGVDYNICIRQEAGRCTLNLSETRPEAVPNSYLLDATATATNVCAAAGTCLIIDGAKYGGQIFSSMNGDMLATAPIIAETLDTISGVVTAKAPFQVHVRSIGAQQANSLFDLTYRQVPC